MKINFVSDDGGDWEALYIDGYIIDQNHSLDLFQVLDALNIDYERDVAPLREIGQCHEKYDDFKEWLDGYQNDHGA